MVLFFNMEATISISSLHTPGGALAPGAGEEVDEEGFFGDGADFLLVDCNVEIRVARSKLEAFVGKEFGLVSAEAPLVREARPLLLAKILSKSELSKSVLF